VKDIINFLQYHGFLQDDPRFQSIYQKLYELERLNENNTTISNTIDFDLFYDILSSNIVLIEKTVKGKGALPKFDKFKSVNIFFSFFFS